jgi:hypothetical protein
MNIKGDGSEIYMRNAHLYPWLKGKTFSELAAHFPDSVVLGWTSESKKWLNPVKRNPRQVYESPSRPSMRITAHQSNFWCLDGIRPLINTEGEMPSAILKNQKHAAQYIGPASLHIHWTVLTYDVTESCQHPTLDIKWL